MRPDEADHSLSAARQALSDALQADRGLQLSAAEGTAQEITRLLYDRQKQSLQLLDCLKAESCPDHPAKKVVLPVSVWLTGAAVLCTAGCLGLAIFSGGGMVSQAVLSGDTGALMALTQRTTWQTVLIALSALLLVLSLVLSITAHSRRKPDQPIPARIVTDPQRLQQTADTLRTGLKVDLQTITALMDVQNVPRDSSIQRSAAELYTVLYEMQVDAPRDKRLLWAVQVARELLTVSGLQPVDYADTQAALFDVIPVDCDSQQRYPAVCREEDGMLVRRGYYIQKM